MTALAILLSIIILVLAGLLIPSRIDLSVERSNCSWLKEGIRLANEVATQSQSEAKSLRTRVFGMAVDHQDEITSIRAAATAKYERRERDLLTQIQSLSERLAGLKLKTRDDELLVEDPGVAFASNDTEPYSEGLFEFIQALEGEDSRQMVEDYIERNRGEGMIDDQILQNLERGDY